MKQTSLEDFAKAKGNRKFRIPIWLVAVFMIALIASASAALLEYFGRITTTIDVSQAVLVDGIEGAAEITDTLTMYGGEIAYKCHYLKSQTTVPVDIVFQTECSPDQEGITVTYLKATVIEGNFTTIPSKGIPINVTVEDLGEWIQWTFNFFAYSSTTTPQGDGKFAVGLIISLDGTTPAFQVHNNDGACSAYDGGTWLYSPYDPTGGGWHGWHTSEAGWNTPVDSMDLIEAEGDMYYANNPEGILIIRIHKDMLSATFGWAVYATIAHFYSTDIPYSVSVYPEGFQWGNEIFADGTTLEPINGQYTLAPGERLDFCIEYYLSPLIASGTYTVTTTITVP